MESEALSLEELAAFIRAVVASSPSNRLPHIDGRPVTGCGLCQTGVPCESGLPE